MDDRAAGHSAGNELEGSAGDLPGLRAELEGLRQALKAERRETELRLAARDTELARLAQELDQLRRAHEQASAALADREAEVLVMTGIAETRTRDALRDRRQLTEARRELTGLYQSSSWRITAPLRAVRQLLRR